MTQPTPLPPQPLVSVIMATKNSERFIEEALQSVAAQRYESYEIVIIDGNSIDRTASIVRQHPRATLFRQAQTGFADAWNQGIRSSRGDLICFLDSDDRWTPRKLELQVAYLQNNPTTDLVVGNVSFFAESGKVLPSTFRKNLISGAFVAHMPGAVMARRHVFDVIGLFDTTMTIASDIDWFAKVKDSNLQVGILQELLIEKRVHDTNLSYTEAKGPRLDAELLLTLRRSVLRQRDRESQA